LNARPTNRIQTNIVSEKERLVLNWICARLPLWITPDRLTALGVFGACLVFIGYTVSWLHPGFLWLAILGFIVHWFGDSLDGSLARFRHIERPLYGHFLDHSVDAFCNLLIMASLGMTAFVHMDVALFALIGYYLLCMHVFLKHHVSGKFQLSFLAFGPTELRICLIGLTLGMYFYGVAGVTLGERFFSIYDFVLLGAGVTFVVLFTSHSLAGISQLRGDATTSSASSYTAVPEEQAAQLR